MKRWQETGRIVDRILSLGRGGRSCALATVTKIEGSAYRRPGAKLLIEDDGSVLGGVSGGCLEEDVRQVGLEVQRSGRARTLHYETADDESKVWGLGLGCDGKVDVLVQPIAAADALSLAPVKELLDGETRFALSMRAEEGATFGYVAWGDSGRLAAGGAGVEGGEPAARAALAARRSQVAADGGPPVFAEVLEPPPTLLVCGAGEDARPLVALAAETGFRVVLVDHRQGLLDPRLHPAARQILLLRAEDAPEDLAGPETFAVVKTHSLRHDTLWAKRLVASKAAYVGLLGPRKRTVKILSELGKEGDPRIFGPVGLDLGAEGAEQVALAIVAEVLAVHRRRAPRHLREREAPVHAGA